MTGLDWLLLFLICYVVCTILLAVYMIWVGDPNADNAFLFGFLITGLSLLAVVFLFVGLIDRFRNRFFSRERALAAERALYKKRKV